MLLVQCNRCGAQGLATDDIPDAAIQCNCCRDHGSADEHIAHVRETGDATCRPLTITLLPGAVSVRS